MGESFLHWHPCTKRACCELTVDFRLWDIDKSMNNSTNLECRFILYGLRRIFSYATKISTCKTDLTFYLTVPALSRINIRNLLDVIGNLHTAYSEPVETIKPLQDRQLAATQPLFPPGSSDAHAVLQSARRFQPNTLGWKQKRGKRRKAPYKPVKPVWGRSYTGSKAAHRSQSGESPRAAMMPLLPFTHRTTASTAEPPSGHQRPSRRRPRSCKRWHPPVRHRP